MGDVVEARQAYEQAQKDARALIERARLNLGRAIHDARREDVSQDAIAKKLGLTREQVRRFQREYEKSAEDAVTDTTS
jgi:transposase